MIFSLSYIECLIEPWADICYWSFERTIYIYVQGHVKMSVCVDAMSYIWCLGRVVSFACDLHWITCLGECWCIHCCLWFACLFIGLKEKEDQFIKEKQGNYKHVWDAISTCFKNTHSLIPPFTPLGVIHRWDSSSHCSTWI